MRCVYFKFSFSHDTLRTLLFELPWTQETRAACCASLLLQQAHWVKGGFFFRFSKWMMEGSSDSGPNFNWVPASGARDGILRAQVDRLIISQCFLRCICTRSQMDNCIRHCASCYYLIFLPPPPHCHHRPHTCGRKRQIGRFQGVGECAAIRCCRIFALKSRTLPPFMLTERAGAIKQHSPSRHFLLGW